MANTPDPESSGKIFDWQVLKKISLFVKPYKLKFFLLLFLTVLTGILAPLKPFLIQKAIDEHVLIGDMSGLMFISGVILALILIQAFIEYIDIYLSSWLGQTIIKDIRVALYAHLLKFRLRFFDHTPIGRLITRNISDIETIADIFTEGLASIAGDTLQLVFITSLMLFTDWRMTLISLSVIPFLLLSTYIFKETIKVSFRDVRNAVANLNTFVQEHITGMNIVQIFNSEEREYQKFEKINEEHLNANLKSVLAYSIYFPIAEVLSAAGIGLLVWYGAQGVLEGVTTLGTLVAFIMYISMFFRPIRTIADKFNTLQMGIVSSSRVLKLLEDRTDIANSGSLAPLEFRGKVEFKAVWFAYVDDQYVLRNVDFKVESGQTLALVGATGAGKSSIIQLLTRFYEIQKGEILIDDRPHEEYQLSFLREHVGMVLQDVFLFSDSIKENIRLGNQKITDAQIRHAADLVGATTFIEKLPGGFDYQVMERGATLSVGQRQLISFVRALVYDPQILILDEATSSVDSETEMVIQKAIEVMMKGRTSIVIAHRLSTIKNADQILVLDKGEVKEQGTHAQLLQQEGLYHQLIQMQQEVASEHSLLSSH